MSYKHVHILTRSGVNVQQRYIHTDATEYAILNKMLNVYKYLREL
jgi:hypothetical protein